MIRHTPNQTSLHIGVHRTDATTTLINIKKGQEPPRQIHTKQPPYTTQTQHHQTGTDSHKITPSSQRHNFKTSRQGRRIPVQWSVFLWKTLPRSHWRFDVWTYQSCMPQHTGSNQGLILGSPQPGTFYTLPKLYKLPKIIKDITTNLFIQDINRNPHKMHDLIEPLKIHPAGL